MIILTFLGLILIFFIGFTLFNDLSVKTKKRFDFKNILLIYPHPDDEVFTAGGFVRKFSGLGTEINLLILTRGEKGTPDAHKENSLKTIRTKEAEKVAKIIGIHKLIFKDFPDGGLDKKKPDIKKEIQNQIEELKPELIITFDETGLYGHPDHVAASEIVTVLIEKKYRKIKLWYASSPEKVLKIMNLPEHMAKDKEFKRKRKDPSIKIFVGTIGLLAKIRGIYAYQSQFESFPKAFPISQIPLWCYFLIQPYEYFHEAN